MEVRAAERTNQQGWAALHSRYGHFVVALFFESRTAARQDGKIGALL